MKKPTFTIRNTGPPKHTVFTRIRLLSNMLINLEENLVPC